MFLLFLKEHKLTSRAAGLLKDLLNFEIDPQMTQRKYVEFGKTLSRIASLDLVMRLGETGFRKDLIENAKSILQQEITQIMTGFNFAQNAVVIEDYKNESNWSDYVIA